MAANTDIQPTFNPEDVGTSMAVIHAQIPIKARWLAGSIVGEFASIRRGIGHEPDGIREYTDRDKVRNIDWRLTARQSDIDSIKVRVHHRDITPDFWVLTDVLKNGYTADTHQYHKEQNLGLSAIMGLMRIADSMGMPSMAVAVDDQNFVLPARQPQRASAHLFRTARTLAEAALQQPDATPTKNLTDVLKHGTDRIKKSKSAVAVVADFRGEVWEKDEEFSWQAPLKFLRKQGSDLLVVELIDPLDFRMRKNTETIRDPGVNKAYIVNTSQAVKEHYAQRAIAKQAAIDEAIKDVRAHHIKLWTNDPLWRDSFRDQLRRTSRRRKT